MNFGLTSKIGEYYLAQQYRKNAAIGKSSCMSFAEYTDYYESELRAKGMPLIEYSQMVKSAGRYMLKLQNGRRIMTGGIGQLWHLWGRERRKL